MTPQHFVMHMDLPPIYTRAQSQSAQLFAVPVTDSRGVHVDTYIGFTLTSIEATMETKMDRIARDYLQGICTGLYNVTKRLPINERLTIHPYILIDLGIFCAEDEARTVKGMLRYMVNSISGNLNTMDIRLQMFEQQFFDRLQTLKNFVCPNMDIRHFS